MTVAIVERLPVPMPSAGSEEFVRVAAFARRLAADPSDDEAMAQLQGLAARFYEMDERSFAHVLETFPLVDPKLREASLKAFIGTV